MLDVGYLGDLPEQFDLPAVVHRHEAADLGVHASLVHAGAVLLLLGALEPVHVGRGSAHVPEDAVESLLGSDLPGLAEDGLLAPGYHGAALHHGYGAEVAFAVASAVGGDGVADGVHCLHVALLRVVGVDLVLVIQLVDPVQRLGVQVLRGRVLHQIPVLAGLLDESPCVYGVAVVVELLEHAHEVRLVLHARFVTGKFGMGGRRHVGDVAYPPDRMPVLAVAHCLRQLEGGHLAHAVSDDIGLGIEEDRPPQAVGPGVVMSEAPQTGLDPAEYDGFSVGVLLD